jgi:hypothetical protein
MSVWTSSGRFSIFDSSTSIVEDDMHLYEFCWDWSAKDLGEGATMAIFVDGVCTAASNVPINGQDSIVGAPFTAFDNEWMDYQLECSVADVLTYSSVPMHLRGAVGVMPKTTLNTGYVAVGRKTDTLVWTEPWSNPVPRNEGGVIQDSSYAMAACDTSGDLYVLSTRGIDGYGSVSVYSDGGPPVRKGLADVPRCIAVTQLDGMDYPKIYENPVRRCPYVWVGSGSNVLLCDHFLEELRRTDVFASVTCIAPLSDGRAWVVDRDSSSVVLLDNDLTMLATLHFTDPEFCAASVDGNAYVFDREESRVYFVEETTIKKHIHVAGDVVKMDVDPGTGAVLLFNSDGSVLYYDWYLRPKSQWNVCTSIYTAAVRRGYERDTVVILDCVEMMLYEFAYEGVSAGAVVARYRIPPGPYSKSLAVPAASIASLESTAPMNTLVASGVSVVSSLEVGQFTVDRLSVDLSGGGDNETEGDDSPAVPTDLPFGISKGTRLPK